MLLCPDLEINSMGSWLSERQVCLYHNLVHVSVKGRCSTETPFIRGEQTHSFSCFSGSCHIKKVPDGILQDTSRITITTPHL